MNYAQMALLIKNLCKEKKITIKSMLSDCGLNKGFMYGLEKEGKSPSCNNLIKLADYFNVSIDYLVGRSDKKEL